MDRTHCMPTLQCPSLPQAYLSIVSDCPCCSPHAPRWPWYGSAHLDYSAKRQDGAPQQPLHLALGTSCFHAGHWNPICCRLSSLVASHVSSLHATPFIGRSG